MDRVSNDGRWGDCRLVVHEGEDVRAVIEVYRQEKQVREI